ncbi:conserved Plasmodium protein, unknown function [Plasmodium gallinaceum]|uniref:Uncharacterized protein n=1 Tax=Plasmodium gallinaceum TaxID=5849 RepID=A0A1J1GVM4_PLAGA|nr:conserved Plasmodium protein, unknown function [Plasmodium gallinaceum]CRG96522.1 conserved Plasmodium protein, unknown function [Plasmodium gallinaceum]
MLKESYNISMEKENDDVDEKKGLNEKLFQEKDREFVNNIDTVDSKNINKVNIRGANDNSMDKIINNINIEKDKIFKTKKKKNTLNLSENNKIKLENKKEILISNEEKENGNLTESKILKEGKDNNDKIIVKRDNRANKEKYLSDQNLDKDILNKGDISHKIGKEKKEKNDTTNYDELKKCDITNKESNTRKEKNNLNSFKKEKEKLLMKEVINSKKGKNILEISNKQNVMIKHIEHKKNSDSLNTDEIDNNFELNNDYTKLKNVDEILENNLLNKYETDDTILFNKVGISKDNNSNEKAEVKDVECNTKIELNKNIHNEINLKEKILEKKELRNTNNKKMYDEKCEERNYRINDKILDEKKDYTERISCNEEKQYKKESSNKNESSLDNKNKNKRDTLHPEKINRKKKINNFSEENIHVKKKKINNFLDEDVIKEKKDSSSINEEIIHEKKKCDGTNFEDEDKIKDKKYNNSDTDEMISKECINKTKQKNDNGYECQTAYKKKYEEMTRKNDLYKNEESKLNEFSEDNKINQVSNKNKGENTKKKYTRLLKSLQTNLTKKIINKECEKRIKSWGDNITLQEKINYFINNKIATKTEYKYGKKPNTLSICNQFSLYNHLTMLNDFNRLHYYRAAMRWTGHKDSCNTNNNFINNENNLITTDYINNMSNTLNLSNTINGENTNSICNTESIYSMSNTINVNNNEGYNLNKSSEFNKIDKPNIFFENNKGCYVYNKNIIEIGTGPLSLLSINAILNGAKHVDALEVNKDASDMAKKLIEGYNLEDYIKIINCYSKVYEYKEEEQQRRLKKKNSLYNFFDNSSNENFCNNFNYDLIISEVIGDFASQEGVADIYLDLHKKIFSYRKYQEYLYNWNVNKDSIEYAMKTKSKEENKNDMSEKKKLKNEDIIKKEKKLSYSEFSANEDLYNSEEFYNMNIKSIPYSVTTYYCPVKFPYSDNIIYKSENYPERTIISPQNKLLQSVILDWSNLTLNEKENNEDNDFGVLEYLYLEQNLKNQVLQKRSNIFHIQKNAPFCGFLITIDVEIRKGEHFGTKYGTCDSWYTNIVLLKDEIKVEKDDLIINKTYTNLLNYNENIIDRKTVLVSRPSYTFYGYILRLIKEKYEDSPFDTDDMNSGLDKKCSESNYSSNENNYVYLDDETILLLDQKDFHTKFLISDVNKGDNEDSHTNEEFKTNDANNKLDNSIKIKKHDYSKKKSNTFEDQIKSKDNDSCSQNISHLEDINADKNMCDNKSNSNNILYSNSINNKENSNNILEDNIEKKYLGNMALNKNDMNCENSNSKLSDKLYNESKENKYYSDVDNSLKENNTNVNTKESESNSIESISKNVEKNENITKKISKNNTNKKKKKDTQKTGHKSKKASDKSKEEYEKDISDIINNYNLYSKFYYDNLKNKIIVYKNLKYKILSFYEPVVIDYDEQATVIYKKDDIYNSRENNVNKFVNNVYQ